ncbi:MAG TPA: hypothetical protein DDX19_01855 [Rhodopirellula baltica]|nr:hypothetical protein [Rhodopirellula baltica]
MSRTALAAVDRTPTGTNALIAHPA